MGDVELTYELTGQGEPSVLIHASPFVSWYRPLVDYLPGCTVLRYRRRVQPDRAGVFRPLTAGEDAAICARLMDHIEWPIAHVAGHSYGALVALALALDHPSRVRSISLLGTRSPGISSSKQVVAALQPIIAAYRAGDKEAAMDGFLRTVGGTAIASSSTAAPGGIGEAVAEADLFFQAEQAAVGQFSFGPEDAGRITQPVLNVLGSDSVPRFVETSRLVDSWFPRAERFVLQRRGPPPNGPEPER